MLLRYFGIRASIVDFVYKPHMDRDSNRSMDRNSNRGVDVGNAITDNTDTSLPLSKKQRTEYEHAQPNSTTSKVTNPYPNPIYTDLNDNSKEATAYYASKLGKTAALNMGLSIADWLRCEYFDTMQVEWDEWMRCNGNSGSSSGSTGGCGGYLPPVYLQHQGHSRTIIGFDSNSSSSNSDGGSSKRAEAWVEGVKPDTTASTSTSNKRNRPSTADSSGRSIRSNMTTSSSTASACASDGIYLFDPSSSGALLKQNLERYVVDMEMWNNSSSSGSSTTTANTANPNPYPPPLKKPSNNWSKVVKRGVHTFSKKAYQIVYIQPGVMGDWERGESKVIHSMCVT